VVEASGENANYADNVDLTHPRVIDTNWNPVEEDEGTACIKPETSHNGEPTFHFLHW
jgi:hypothetical protein